MARRIDGRNFIVGDDLADIFAEAGISPGRARLSPGRNVKVRCPACQARDEDSLSVKIDADGQGAAWHCFRGTCGGSWIVPGSGRVEGADQHRRDAISSLPERRLVVSPVPDSPDDQKRPGGLLRLFQQRGISEETLGAFGVYGTSREWPMLDEAGKPVKDGAGKVLWGPAPTIVFPYLLGGELVNRKFRSDRKQFAQDRDALRSLYNVDAVESPDMLLWVEGEMDVLACWEAGLRQVVSLPDGAPSKLLEEDDPRRQDDARFEALQTCADQLAGIERIYIGTDMDVPGNYLAEELARRLGRIRCWRVTWPEGCKDANETLVKLGPEAVQRAVAEAQPMPLAGIFDMPPGTLREFLHSGKGEAGLGSGIATLDEIAKLPQGSGWLTVLTGVPSHGKSSFLRTWLTFIAMKHRIGIVWCSPEDNRPETLALRLCSVILKQPMKSAGAYVPSDMLARAEDFIREHVTFLWSNDPDVEMSLDWVLKRAEEAKKRHKRNLLVLDPWNEFEHQFTRHETETQYTGRWLRKLKAWGRAEGMGILIAAHPTKMLKDPKKGYPVADGYDINGGANWFNKADLGLTVYRREEGFPEIHCWKARFEAFGKRHEHARLVLDPRSGRLASPGRADSITDPMGGYA
ncbi:toprim domain-containing protein [Pseudoroseomonas cervicalis]|uniref:toprim domain-containing protein n=1 Tax=Teichococcus cervicalis TaxID=204525 RepID=UPI0027821365|nr:toprim domain-containing protein [Pseudoroseomonas cervicalis]MDQ1081430.1 twinkle protein [Pseudoroseomonas cervicalis]